jgi:hypothetical protein
MADGRSKKMRRSVTASLLIACAFASNGCFKGGAGVAKGALEVTRLAVETAVVVAGTREALEEPTARPIRSEPDACANCWSPDHASAECTYGTCVIECDNGYVMNSTNVCERDETYFSSLASNPSSLRVNVQASCIMDYECESNQICWHMPGAPRVACSSNVR